MSTSLPVLREPTLAEEMRQATAPRRLRDLVVDPAGGIFNARSLAAALRKAAAGQQIYLPSGTHDIDAIGKSIALTALLAATPQIHGTLTVTGGTVILTGLELVNENDGPALVVEDGTVILDSCAVRGGIRTGTVGKSASLFVRNSSIEGKVECLALACGSNAEIHTSRLANGRFGVSAGPDCSLALYHTRIELCRTESESELGSGIFAEAASVYGEAVTFVRNGVGLYLQNCSQARLIASHFQANDIASVISRDSRNVELHGCFFENHTSTECAQVTTSGGMLRVADCVLATAPAPGIVADHCDLGIESTRILASRATALDVRSCTFRAAGLHCKSATGIALVADECQGEIVSSTFCGDPPTSITRSPDLVLTACRGEAPGSASHGKVFVPSTIEHFVEKLRRCVSQAAVREEIERLFRSAHASRERRLSGLSSSDHTFHLVLAGPPGTGKKAAAELVTQGLHAFGIAIDDRLVEIAMAADATRNGLSPEHGGGSQVLFVRLRSATSFSTDVDRAVAEIREILYHTPHVVFIEGEEEDIHRLFRAHGELRRFFPHVLHFKRPFANDLMTLFYGLCERDHILLSSDTVRHLLIFYHLNCDRKDRRYATTRGVEVLYESARHRFLERCSLANRFDFAMEPSDLDLPHDRGSKSALERNPAFISVCPDCSKENPWIPGRGEETRCVHCGSLFNPGWGLWVDSLSYRRLHETQSISLESGAISRRAQHLVR